jgi:hypothetical protein
VERRQAKGWIEMRKFLAVTLVCACVEMAAAPATARDHGIYGARSDTTVRDECPAGQYLVGLVGSAGIWLDQITVVCASLNSDMTWSSGRTLPARRQRWKLHREVLREE